MKSFSEEFGAIHTQLLCPALSFRRFALTHSKADHCHTVIILCMTLLDDGRDKPANPHEGAPLIAS